MIKKWIYSHLIHFVFPNKGVTHIKRSPKLIVSLTSHPGRIHVVERTIDSILRQSLKPDEVILWLAESQFPRKEHSLPRSLKKYLKHGLQIKWCEDIRSYKKLIPTLKEFPNDIIVTADDDVVYQENWLELLYVSCIKYPHSIHCHHAFHYKYSGDDNFMGVTIVDCPGILSGLSMAIGVGGILYPPNTLSEYVNKEDVFQKIAPTNDDFWFWAMAHLNNTEIRVVDNYIKDIVCIDGTQQDGLWVSINSNEEGTKQFKNIINHYPALQAMLE